MKKILLFLLFFDIDYCSYGQNEIIKVIYPEIGRPMPHFILEEVDNFSRKQVNLNEFKGKWLVLDWWTYYCASCIESFPKVNALQSKFGNKVQFILIGYTGTGTSSLDREPGDKKVRRIFNRSKEVYNLKVPIAYDSILYQKFDLGTTPYIVIVDPQGIVRGITYKITEKNIEDLIAGKHTYMPRAYRRGEDQRRMNYSRDVPLLTYSNGGADTAFIFRSLLTKWDPDILRVSSLVDIYHPTLQGRFEVLGQSALDLYQYAYLGKTFASRSDSLYGKIHFDPIIYVNDSSKLIGNKQSGADIYCYSLIVPKESYSREFMMQTMQRDLKTYFGYEAIVRVHKIPYWRLVVSDPSKVRVATTDSSYFVGGREGFTAKAMGIETLLNWIAGSDPNLTFINETGLVGKIEIRMNTILSDFGSVKKELNENGLDLIKGEKEMKVLVIKDPQK